MTGGNPHLHGALGALDEGFLLVVTGAGDVLEPEDGLIGIGSGGNFALAAAREANLPEAFEDGLHAVVTVERE